MTSKKEVVLDKTVFIPRSSLKEDMIYAVDQGMFIHSINSPNPGLTDFRTALADHPGIPKQQKELILEQLAGSSTAIVVAAPNPFTATAVVASDDDADDDAATIDDDNGQDNDSNNDEEGDSEEEEEEEEEENALNDTINALSKSKIQYDSDEEPFVDYNFSQQVDLSIFNVD